MSSGQIAGQKAIVVEGKGTTLPCGRLLVSGFPQIVRRHFKVCKVCKETVEWVDNDYQHDFSSANLTRKQEERLNRFDIGGREAAKF